MELRKRLVALVGITALMMSVTGGVVSAADSAQVGAVVTLDCAAPMTVTLEAEDDAINFGTVELIAADGATAAPLGLTVNMGCYWGEWSVDASITNFTAPGVLGGSFSASHFSLQEPEVESYFLDPVDTGFDACEPDANVGTFDSAGDTSTILETSTGLVQFLCPPILQGFYAAAPFETTASYTPTLAGLSQYLPSGDYSATLTVVLAGED